MREENSLFCPMDKKMISPYIKWCIGNCPGLCILFFKTSPWYLKLIIYHTVIMNFWVTLDLGSASASCLRSVFMFDLFLQKLYCYSNEPPVQDMLPVGFPFSKLIYLSRNNCWGHKASMTCTVTTVLPFHVPSSLRGNGEICVCPLSVCVSVHMLQQVCVETEMLTCHYNIYILVHLVFFNSASWHTKCIICTRPYI